MDKFKEINLQTSTSCGSSSYHLYYDSSYCYGRYDPCDSFGVDGHSLEPKLMFLWNDDGGGVHGHP